MGIYKDNYDKTLELLENDYLIRTLINSNKKLVINNNWNKHELQGESRYGMILINYFKEKFNIEVISLFHENANEIELMFLENNIQYSIITDIEFMRTYKTEEMSYNNLETIIKFLKFA